MVSGVTSHANSPLYEVDVGIFCSEFTQQTLKYSNKACSVNYSSHVIDYITFITHITFHISSYFYRLIVNISFLDTHSKVQLQAVSLTLEWGITEGMIWGGGAKENLKMNLFFPRDSLSNFFLQKAFYIFFHWRGLFNFFSRRRRFQIFVS